MASPPDPNFSVMEKDLNEDAQWKRIQQNTFTRWTNERLKCVNLRVENLEKDLSDGVLLIKLVEVLSSKNIGRYNKKAQMRTHKLENVSLALQFLEHEEGVHLVNIDSSDIVDQRLKLILGLIWTLILKYSISIPMYEEEHKLPQQTKETPKQRLMTWIQTKAPETHVSNFTTDWKDGKALGALVDSCAPGLCPNWNQWQAKYALENTTEAMDLADNWLGVAKLIEPQEFLNPNVDEMSMMTYLSQYPNARVKPGAPLNAKTDFDQVRVYGPGVEAPKVALDRPVEFFLEAADYRPATTRLLVKITHSTGIQIPYQLFYDEKTSLIRIVYVPNVEGRYEIAIIYNGREVDKSPFKVQAEKLNADLSEVTVTGPGVERAGFVVGAKSSFEIFTGAHKFQTCRVIIVDSDGNEFDGKVERLAENRFRCDYSATSDGLHSVNVFLDGQTVPNSPFDVLVRPKYDAKKVTTFGRGIQPKGVRVGDFVTLTVSTKNASEDAGKVDVKIFGPGGKEIPSKLNRELDERTLEYAYEPLDKGNHEVHILYESQPVVRSPFEVFVGEKSTSNVKVFGPGIESGVENQPCTFTVDTAGETGSVGFSIEGPSKTRIECNQNEDGSADITYTPTLPGHYAVHVLCADEDVPNSPFVAQIAPANEQLLPEKVKCTGPGLDTSQEVNKPVQFQVDAKQAGKGLLKSSVIGPDFKFIDCEIIDNGDGTFLCTYTPKVAGRHFVMVSYGGVAVPDSPYRVYVDEPESAPKLDISGPGVQSRSFCNTQSSFVINYSQPLEGHLQIDLIDSNQNQIPIDIDRYTDDQGTKITANYILPKAGRYEVHIYLDGREIDQSPLNLEARMPADVNKIKMENFQSVVSVNQTNDLRLDCRLLPEHGSDHFKCTLKQPSGNVKILPVIDNLDGTYTIKYAPTEEGQHELDILYDDTPVSHSVFLVQTEQEFVDEMGGPDRSQCLASGPGLTHGFVDVPANFIVETKGDTAGRLNISVEGPAETKIHCTDQKDGSYLVNYIPTAPGEYTVSVLWDEKHIEGSPFTLNVEAPVDSAKVKVQGNGLEGSQVRSGVPLKFHVDAGNSGPGNLNVSVLPKPTLEKMPQICDRGNNQYDVVYFAPENTKNCEVHITYADKEIPNSPFRFEILPAVEPQKVQILTQKDGEQVVPLGGMTASSTFRFTVDASNAGQANLEVVVMGPDNLPYPVDVLDRNDGTYDVSFVPDSTGPYKLVVKYGGSDLPSSPLNFEALPTGDASKCKLLAPPIDTTSVGVQNQFSVQTKNAGPGAVTCRFIPENTKTHEKLRDETSTTGLFSKSATLAPQKTVDVEISSPDQDGIVVVLYKVLEPDHYRAMIKYGGQLVPNGEFTINALSADEFPVGNLPYKEKDGLLLVSQSPDSTSTTTKTTGSEHTVETSSTTTTTTSTTTVRQKRDEPLIPGDTDFPDSTSSPASSYRFERREVRRTHFTQSGASPHDQQEVDESFERSQTTETGDQDQEDSTRLTTEVWNLDIPASLKPLDVFVMMPSGGGQTKDLPSVKENHDGTVTIKYQPKEAGLHEMHILHDKLHVQGSPFQFHVDSVKEGYVTAFGSGLNFGTAGEPCTFTVVVKDAGRDRSILGHGGLSIVVDGPAKTELQCHDNKDGTCSVSWIPPVPGEYKISVKFADKEIKDSPFIARIAGEGRKRAHISVGSTSEVALKISESDVKGMSASIKSPSGIEEPCFMRVIDAGHLGISFTPREVGEHLVSVKKRNVLVPGAPFRIKVGENEVGNANKVNLTGSGLERAITQQFNEFIVNTKQAGFGGLSVSIEGPSKSEIVCKENQDGICRIQYKPVEPGIYVLSVKFADHHVPGSPFSINCEGEGAGTVTQSVEQNRKPANVVFADQQCQLCINMPGATAMDLAAKLTSPSHKTEDVELSAIDDVSFNVKFTPKELGLHTISILHRGVHISGSPFQFTVGPFHEGGAHKVKAGGNGLQTGDVLSAQSFNIYTREAGAGNLSIAIEGPSKAKIDFKDHKDGNCYVTYTVSKPGDYLVSIKFNDQHVPDSPFKVYVLPSTGESRKLEVAQFPDSALPLNKPVTFTILTHGAHGHIDAKAQAPSGQEDDCFITPIDEGESYAVRFVPKEAGNHYVHIRLDGIHMKGSPFRLRVGGKEESDPTAVTAAGNGLKSGETGQKLEYIINTCNAGAGLLNVSIDGPSKVTLDAYEVDVGYKVRYTPMAPGDYYMTIKYNSVHIPGSPFKVYITGKTLGGSGYNECSQVHIQAVQKTGKGVSSSQAPKMTGDPSQVECKGMGLKKANPVRQNAFTVDCSRAGQDLLFVAVLTPKGPSEEVFIKHSGRGLYNVNYLVKDRGMCYIFVRYGNKDVPGSPFVVEV